jgi:hypothetical protein
MRHDRYKILAASSIISYIAVILAAIGLLIFEPNGFDATAVILPLIILLLVAPIGAAHAITRSSANKAFLIVSTVALTILFAFVGLFIVAAVGWLVGLSHAA